MADVLLRPVTPSTSALARTAQCPACAERDVGDRPGEFDPRDWWAALVCRVCGHEWSVCC